MWIDEFLELLYSNDTDNIEKAYKLKNKKIPDYLYKYKSINKNTFDLLETDLIYLSNVANLNDLYEGEFFYDYEEMFYNNFSPKIISTFIKEGNLTDKEIKMLSDSNKPFLELQKIIYETDPLVNKDIPFEVFFDLSLKLHYDSTHSIFEKWNNISNENTFLTCFSEKHDLILMWSYYSNSNEGICIKYNVKDFKEFITRACCPIKYENGYNYTKELLDVKNNLFKLMFDPYLKKETVWRHEKEWRILFNHELHLQGAIKIGEKYFLKLPKPSAIYLGERVSKEDKQKILDICEKREISLYQMKKDIRKANLYEIEIKKYSEKNCEDKLFIVESIKNKNYKSLIRNYFYYPKTNKESKKELTRILDSFKNLSDEEIQLFLDKLLFKQDIFPVSHHYYSSVLVFLIKLYDNGLFDYITTSDGLSIEKNLEQWIGYCISSFYNEKTVRYLIFFEKLFIRFYNRYVILYDEEKKRYDDEFSKYNINTGYVAVIRDKFDEFKLKHPFTNPDQTELIQNKILDNLQTIINLYYDMGKFDEKRCYEEYLKVKSIVEKIEKETESQYQYIFSNSERNMPLYYYGLFEKSFDFQLHSSGVILTKNKHILKLMSSEDKELIKTLGIISFNYKISNSILECCDEMNISYKEKFLINVDEEYFNPKNNPYTLNNSK